MIILPEGMFEGVTDSNESLFQLCARQERDISHVLVPRAGWYNHYGQVLSQGDLALEDFKNIMYALEDLDRVHDTPATPFIVVPSIGGESPPYYHTLSQYELAQRCAFVITAHEVSSFDLLTPTLLNIFHNNGVRLTVGHRTDIRSILGDYFIH